MALESNNAEMTKRLKYTKDILTHMLNNNKPSGNVGAPNQNILGGSIAPLTGATTSTSNRNGTISSAVSSKRSGMAGLTIEGGPSSM
jgi:hypothetical protein